MSEPKISSATAPPAKKLSKKKTINHSSDSPSTSIPSIDAVPLIPRISLAEPKPDVIRADTKRKPSKKRTSAPSNELSSETPDVDISVNVAAKDAEREKQAKKEAKKQRIKEKEEIKYRQQELARQAQEEEEKRKSRAKEELEALNANAEECQEEEDAYDYDDDGFENYDDEFEQEETTTKTDENRDKFTNDTMDKIELRKVQQAMEAETRELQSLSVKPSSLLEIKNSSDKTPSTSRPLTSIASSIAGLKQSLDPRAKRIKEIRKHRKFEVEKFSLFQLNPVSKLDQMLHCLRKGIIQHAFTQTNEGARSLAIQTKTPEMHEKSMHYPDDIGFDTHSSGLNRDNDETPGTSFSSSARFFKFLDSAAYVCETLVVENVMAWELEANENDRDNQSTRDEELKKSRRLDRKVIFPSENVDNLPSLKKILKSRDLVVLRFSPCVSCTLLSCYGNVHEMDKNDDSQDQTLVNLLKNKTISCIWDINLPNRPLHLLKSGGIASTACLSPSRDLFVILGTEDGSLHVWDLRPHTKIQSTSILVDGMAVSTPVYSTCGMNSRAPEQHASQIVALEVIDRAESHADNSGTFQFGSIDDRGVLIIWSLIEFEYAGDEALSIDNCVQIGGKVKLVMNTRIDLQQHHLSPSIGPAVVVLKYFPHDPNQFIIGTRSGDLIRGNRCEKASFRAQYQRQFGLNAQSSSSSVVCIDFNPFEHEYFLVGYQDGSIALYHAEISLNLTSWEEAPIDVSVCAVTWSTSRPAVFYASYSNGNVLVWDFLESTSEPTLNHALGELKDIPPADLPTSLYPLVLSSKKMRTSRPAIAWRLDASVSFFQFAIYELEREFTIQTPSEHQAVAEVLTCIL